MINHGASSIAEVLNILESPPFTLRTFHHRAARCLWSHTLVMTEQDLLSSTGQTHDYMATKRPVTLAPAPISTASRTGNHPRPRRTQPHRINENSPALRTRRNARKAGLFSFRAVSIPIPLLGKTDCTCIPTVELPFRCGDFSGLFD